MNAFYQVFLYLENKEDFDATAVLTNQYGDCDISMVPLFSKAVYSLGLEHLDEIEKNVGSHLVNWTFDRLDNVAKAILFLGVSEGCYAHLAPRKVVISESVNLAKSYLKEGDYKFINAVLDKSIPDYDFKGE
jgi:transcription antitermination factor NusB